MPLNPHLRPSAYLLYVLFLSVCSPAWAIINNPADSAIFPFAYEGDAASLSTWGTANYFGSATGYTLTGDSPSAGILDVSIDTGHPTPGLVLYLQSPDWYANATHADGWTWEVKFRLKTGRFSVRIGDETDHSDILDVLADGRVTSRIKGTLTTLPSTTDAMHTYRIAQAPNSTEYNVWVDEALIGSYAAASTGLTGNSHWFSDGSGSVNGSYELDFLRFTPGGYSPPGYNPPDPNCYTWNINSLGRWDDAGSWNQPGTPNDNQKTAVFGNVITSPRTAVVDGSVTVKNLEFNSTFAYSVSGLGSITLDADTGNATISVQQSPVAGHQIQAALNLQANTVATTAAGTKLNINSLVTLNGNTFTISPGSNVQLNNGTAAGTGGLIANLGTFSALGTIDGDFTNSPEAILAVDLSHNQTFNVTGTAALAGELDLSLGSLDLSFGDTFSVLSAAGGIIDEGFTLSDGFTYSIVGNDLLVTFIPEPSSVVLMLAGLCLLANRKPGRAAKWMLMSIVFACPASAWAVINNPANSSTFGFKYEGDTASLATFGNTGYAGSTTGYTLTGDSPSPGILDVSIDTGHATPGLVVYLQSPTWVSTATNAAGWTWETSLRMKTGSFVVRVGDEGGAHTILTINADGTVGNFFTGAFHTMPSTTDTQHVYRVAQSANSGQFDLWIDNNYVTSFLGNSQLGTGGNHWWSDGSGSTSGEYEMDYVRYRAGGTSPTGFTPDANRIVWMSGSLARWDDSVNWNNSNSTPGAPNSNQVTAVFGGANVASRTVDLDGNFTVKGLEFAASNTNRYGLVGLGSLTLSSNSGNASIAVLGSSAAGHQIQVATTLASNTDLSTVPGARIDFNNLLNLGGRTLNIAAGSTVNINNNLDSGTSGTVSNTGTLGGNGRVNGSLTNSGGTVSPGLDVGIFTVDGNFTQSSTGTLAVDLASETSFDVLNVLGSATLDGTLDISLLGFEPTESDTFTILTTTGGIIDNGLVVTGGTGLSYSVVGNNLVLSFQESLPGDFDGDGDVDGRDFLAWQRGSSPSPFSSIDLAAWQSAYNGGALAAATTVPEPTCLVILGVTCCIGTLLRRKVAL